MNEADNTTDRRTSDSAAESAVSIEFSVRVESLCVELSLLRSAIEAICVDAGKPNVEISVAIVANPEMQQLHRQFLNVDETTDVMSFPIECTQESLAGDIVVCQDVACEKAHEYGCSPEQELLLYVVHGMLHLVGYDDTTEIAFQAMKEAERDYMKRFGFTVTNRDQSAHPEGETS